MHVLKTERRATSISQGGMGRHMKEVACHICEHPIRFLIKIPNLCPECTTVTDFPENNYETLRSRFLYHVEEF